MFDAKLIDRDLREPLSDQDVAELKRQLYEHLVLVFHDQRLSSADFVDFARQLGETEPSEFRQQNVSAYRCDHPEILVLDTDYDPGGGTRHRKKRTEGWHSDPRSPGERDEIGILLAVGVSDSVAPTQWLDLRAAYASMPPDQQAFLSTLTGIHRNTHSDVEEVQEFHRPMVSRHPVTGALSLDVHENSLWDIEGIGEAEGRRLIDDLFERIDLPGNIYTHRWRTHDVVIWDNLSLVHRRLGPMSPDRVLHRIYAHEPESSELTTARLRADLARGANTAGATPSR